MPKIPAAKLTKKKKIKYKCEYPVSYTLGKFIKNYYLFQIKVFCTLTESFGR